MALTAERIELELLTAKQLKAQFGSNAPELKFEDGVEAALAWVLGQGIAPLSAPFGHEPTWSKP